jgi:hypothetical protein
MSRGIPAYFKRHAISIEQGRLSKYDGLAGTPEEVEKIFLEDIPAETKTWKKKKGCTLCPWRTSSQGGSD